MILTIDQGTSSSRALVINPQGAILGIAQKEFTQIFPQAAWVEQNPEEIWQTTLEVCREVIQTVISEGKASPDDFQGIAITNQRETSIVWDTTQKHGSSLGTPVYNAIVWQCRRTSDYCNKLKQDNNFSDYVRKNTGLYIDSYFSGTKIAWILENVPNLNTENLLFGTVDTWLLWNLTEGRSHYTEPSNASRSMLYNLHTSKWDQTILAKLKIPPNILPEVIPSNSEFGTCSLFKDLLGKELPIKAILGDQQAALYAYGSETKSAKCTYGTGAFILIPSDDSLVPGLVTSSAYQQKFNSKHSEEKTQKPLKNKLALEGSIFIAGAIVQWLRDGLGLIGKSSEVEALAKTVKDNGGVYLIPALAGLGAPHWNQEVRGSIFGLTRASNKGHIARAALESIVYQVRDIFEQLKSTGSQLPEALNVDGGAAKNDLLMQMQADTLGIPIKRYQETEMTSLGVARMTGLVSYELVTDKVFEPQKNTDAQYKEWRRYLNLLLEERN